MKASKRVLFFPISDEDVLAINTVSGAIDIFDPQTSKFLKEDCPSDYPHIDPTTLERLKKRGYVFENEAAENAMLQAVFAAHAHREKRLSIVLCLTYSCNLRCTYCYEGELTHGDGPYMGSEDIARVFAALDELRRMYPERKVTVELFGGEPLLPETKPSVLAVLKEARLRSLPVRIVTNATHIAAFSDMLGEYRDTVGAVQITLDGPKNIHDKRRKSANGAGTFDTTCKAIDALLAMGIKTGMRINVDRQNISFLPELLELVTERGWIKHPHFAYKITPVLDHTLENKYKHILFEDELIEALFELFAANPTLKDAFSLDMFRNIKHLEAALNNGKRAHPLLYYCEANNLENMIFGPDGYIYACTECIGNQVHAIGEFRPTFKIYSEAAAKWDGRNILSLDKCRECDIALLCGGGCAYSALAVNGDVGEPVCNRARETVLTYLSCIRDKLAGLAG